MKVYHPSNSSHHCQCNSLCYSYAFFHTLPGSLRTARSRWPLAKNPAVIASFPHEQTAQLMLGGLLSSATSLAPCCCFTGHRDAHWREAVCSASCCAAIAPASQGSQKCWDIKTHLRKAAALLPFTHTFALLDEKQGKKFPI